MENYLDGVDWIMIVIVFIVLGATFFLLKKKNIEPVMLLVALHSAALIIAWPVMFIIYVTIPKFF
jgi:hypothetical protein